ncbi:hypothetical protein B0T19DRAFT_400840 [Cercophora scortea]|uniref:Uncharacterized protein n=1 Tax=Cercophora scortea TaxID=314031 RepID=A0AAE0IPC5_9PEZI|nr:hypothetical protein B0T19DRAFT_400840 [Cercophora scortea]
MCHGLPTTYVCGHASTIWHYCPSAKFDLQTGYKQICKKTTTAKSQQSNEKCPNTYCNYGSNWTCCQCGGMNAGTGWCTYMLPAAQQGYHYDSVTQEETFVDHCNHTACGACIITGQSSSSAAGDHQGRRDKRKSSRRGQQEDNAVYVDSGDEEVQDMSSRSRKGESSKSSRKEKKGRKH